VRHFPVQASSAVLLLWVLTCLTSCGSGSSADRNGAASSEAATGYSWTYMIYMAADNNLSDAAEADINEMERVGSTADVSVAVQAEFMPAVSEGLPASTVRGRIVRDNDRTTIGSWYSEIGDRNMADPATLTEFITWAAREYPADHYALVLWSHGSGWKDGETGSPILDKGMIVDTDSEGSSYRMSLQDIADAVGNSSVFFDVIDFDSCLMGMYEVAYEFKDLASYLVFSEDVYPVSGDSYDTILKELTENPGMDGALLAQTIVEKCMEYYRTRSISVTKSAVGTAQIDEFHAGICTLAEYLSDHMSVEGPNIESARAESVAYQYPENHDLGDFLEKLDGYTGSTELKTIIGQVAESLSQVVVSSKVFSLNADDKINDSMGVAIYLPSGTQASLGEIDRYSRLSCSRSASFTWANLVNQIVTGNPVISRESAIGSSTALYTEGF